MAIKNILLDTSFLIELAKPNSPCHENAKAYYKYFCENGISCYLSPIVVSEYWQKTLAEDFPNEYFKFLTYSQINAIKAGYFMRLLYASNPDFNPSNTCTKNDIMILTHLLVNPEIDAFITKDQALIDGVISLLKSNNTTVASKTIYNVASSISSNLQPQLALAL